MRPIPDNTDGQHLYSAFILPLDPNSDQITPPPSYFDLYPQTINNQTADHIGFQVSVSPTITYLQPICDRNSTPFHDPVTGAIGIQNSRSANQHSKDKTCCSTVLIYCFAILFMLILLKIFN